MIPRPKAKNTVLVVLSGGQDSITCLGLALRDFAKVEAISFDYGQRHKVELGCAIDICLRYGVPHKVVSLAFLPDLVTSGLVGDGAVDQPHPANAALPNSFVPNRNALFLTIAHAHAQEIGASVVVTGVCQTDYSGYPDCRAEFILALNVALNIGYKTQIAFAAPMMHINKAQTFLLAAQCGFLEEVIHNSHTCYNGDHVTFNEWGFGCGTCPACMIRAAGWDEFKATHPELAAPFVANYANYLAAKQTPATD